MNVCVRTVFEALARVLVHAKANPEAVRLRLIKQAKLADKNLITRERVGAILDALPKSPRLYWHGADGLPCPCAICVADATAIYLAAKRGLELPR